MTKLNRPKKRSRAMATGRLIIFLFLITAVIAALIGGALIFEPEKPIIVTGKNIEYLGKKVSFPIQVSDKRSGLKSIIVSIKQGSTEKEIFSKQFPRSGWLSNAGPASHSETLSFETKNISLKDGSAELIVTAHDFSLKGGLQGNETVQRFPVEIDTKPPKIRIRHTQRYILPGGSGIVVYSLSEEASKHGVVVNDNFFPGYPMTGKENRYIAYIAMEWDARKITNSNIVAHDKAGNPGKTIFSMILKKSPDKKDNINISDNFLNRKIPEFEEFYPKLSGSNIEKFIQINNKVRMENSTALKNLCKTSNSERLWKDRFLRMTGASRANFADQRTYFYQGKPIDQQVHLGRDLASTANAPVKAANHGKVIYTDYKGIYGNTVILDHGQGLFSLYSHLSRIDTSVDEMVEKGTVIGHSGATGMAGGDHLHFSMLINGVFITPLEWWDQHWIDVNITDVLNDTGL